MGIHSFYHTTSPCYCKDHLAIVDRQAFPVGYYPSICIPYVKLPSTKPVGDFNPSPIGCGYAFAFSFGPAFPLPGVEEVRAQHRDEADGADEIGAGRGFPADMRGLLAMCRQKS
jgi:hypothetical protein